MNEADTVVLALLCCLGHDYEEARARLRRLKWWALGGAVLLVAFLVSWMYLVWRWILS